MLPHEHARARFVHRLLKEPSTTAEIVDDLIKPGDYIHAAIIRLIFISTRPGRKLSFESLLTPESSLERRVIRDETPIVTPT
jgi:hypothetical protein